MEFWSTFFYTYCVFILIIVATSTPLQELVVEMECCDSGPCGPPCVVDLDGVSIREVMEVLRGVSREEIISQLEGIGFYFDEKEIVKQLNRLDTEAQRRVMREAGWVEVFAKPKNSVKSGGKN